MQFAPLYICNTLHNTCMQNKPVRPAPTVPGGSRPVLPPLPPRPILKPPKSVKPRDAGVSR